MAISPEIMQASRPIDASAVLELTDPSTLKQRLLEAARGLSTRRAYLGIALGGRRAIASIGEESSQPRVPVGCIAKLLTAMLVDEEIASGHINLDVEIGGFLGLPETPPQLRHVLIRHLLDHTHGIDDSAIRRAPLHANGLIDAEVLGSYISALQRKTLPGERYSYSNIGSWLLGAFLEHRHRASIRELFRDRLFRPYGFTDALVDTASMSTVCASIGEPLSLSPADLLGLLELTLSRGTLLGFGGGEHRTFEAEINDLPGWSPTDFGMRRGWKYYENGWFGQSSDLAEMPAYLRLHPRHGIAIVVASDTHSSFTIASAILRDLLPGAFTVRIPTLLTSAEQKSLNLERYVGRYQSAGFHLVISRTGRSELGLEVRDLRSSQFGDSTSFSAALTAAKDNLFIAKTSRAKVFRFVQFLPQSSDEFQFVWNGRWSIPSVYR